ncbi:MAG: DNA-processing protein DprA [Acetobacter sp.]|uniref:DNA-processing protein DprA n=1 Tax=Acetobacter sp. TaxID=440 RepID=UPI0039E96203
MMQSLSSNTQAILLLTAPLIAGRGNKSSDLLSPGEYKRLARHLREIQHQPADLLLPDAAAILRACQPVIDENRLKELLGRGFLLSQVIERWQARAIWVVSRADAEYPRRLKARLREDAPAVLYGCGDMSLLETGGLAVVGSRNVDAALIDYTVAVGQLAARAGRTLISGGAKGIDQAAMRGALEGGGSVCGVLADSLEKITMNRENRNLLLDGQLVLISPYDPSARFNVGNAMQRNKLIYALADASLVVSSDLNKGGTWAGAVEQLDKLKLVPVFVRSADEPSAGLDGLRKKGALPWPNPQAMDSFEALFNMALPTPTDSSQFGLSLLPNEESSPVSRRMESVSCEDALITQIAIEASTSDPELPIVTPENLQSVTQEDVAPAQDSQTSAQTKLSPAETLFATVRVVIGELMNGPRKIAEVAAALDVSNAQAKIWLQRLVDEGVLEKQKKPAGYALKVKRMFD